MALTNPQETILTRPTCCEFTSGRVFYGSGNTVYYSQVLENVSMTKVDQCYQVNDPTSEHISDLLATDGGTVQIDNATDIIQIKKFGGGVLVYATNGVWYLHGVEGGFTAINYAMDLVSEAGCISAQAVVPAEATQYYWSGEGLYAITLNQFGKAEAQNIIEGTLQTHYNAIPRASKQKATGTYNRIRKQIEWHYPLLGDYDYLHAMDASLLLDTRTGGIWPQSYSAITVEGVGNFIACSVNTNQGTEDRDSIKVVISTGTPNVTQTYNIDFAFKDDVNFQDFGAAYPTAYIETGYETLDKPSNKKVVPYINTHFLQTEQNWIADGSGGLTLDLQSGCQMRAKWDWNDSSANGRWSPAQQAYRFRRPFTPSVAGTFDSGETVIATKSKMLGRGEAISIRFEQETGKDMQLLGYTCVYSVKGRM